MGDVENGSVLGLPLTKRSRVSTMTPCRLLFVSCCVTRKSGADKLGSATDSGVLGASCSKCIHFAVNTVFSPLRTSLWNLEDPVQRKMIHQVG